MLLLKDDPDLSISNLCNIAKKNFSGISDNKKGRKFNLPSMLMSGLAIFYFKFPSLLEFSEQGSKPVKQNMFNLFGIENIPSDTYFREVIDEVATSKLMYIFKEYTDLIKNKGLLEKYKVLNKYLLVSIDGTGFFQSNNVHCDQCLQRKMKGGEVSYEHQALPAVIVHPDHKEVFPIGLEFIEKKDGEIKNDCERNAVKRLLPKLRESYPDMDIVIVEDGLSSNIPHIKELEKNKMSYILGIKPGDHKKFFSEISEFKSKNKVVSLSIQEELKSVIIYRNIKYKNIVYLKNDKEEIILNYIELEEIVQNKKSSVKKVTTYTWITNLPIDTKNVYGLIKMGRARWRIENETFNTLKNQGYNFEHNYGHGDKNLANNMAVFMFLAFLMDQIQQTSSKIYQEVLKVTKRKKYLFNFIRSFFTTTVLKSFNDLYIKILKSYGKYRERFVVGFCNTC